VKVLLASLLLVAAGVASGDPVADGLRLYKEGKFAAAVTAFREALAIDPDNARLNYNLALALWRSGDADGAETAAEKASALAKGEFDGLRDGILGNLRYDKARALGDAKVGPQKEVEQLQQAVAAAGTARNHFQRSAVELLQRNPNGGAQVQRNLERAIKLEEELKKRLEEAKKKQKEQKKKDDENEKNDPDKKEDKKKDPTQKDKKDDKNRDDKKSDEKDEKPEPKPDEKKNEKDDKNQKKEPEKKPGQEEKNKPKDPTKPQEVPGEHDPSKQLTPEQRRELLKRLKEFDEKLKTLKAARKAARPRVKKDW
jgi:Ca-activated chloride channel homolog